MSLISREACGKLSVSRVVKAMGCSRRLAEQRFRDQTGKSILSAIQDVRVERACTLLRTTHATANAIANVCGYSKDVFLQKLFRKRFGKSMSDYRRNADTAHIKART